jgi:hypothetical protein
LPQGSKHACMILGFTKHVCGQTQIVGWLYMTSPMSGEHASKEAHSTIDLPCYEALFYPFPSFFSLVINDKTNGHKAMSSNVLHVIYLLIDTLYVLC